MGMKKIIVVLISFLFLISCSSPERKIKESFNFQRPNRHRAFKVESVKIYDTIYSKTVFENQDIFRKQNEDLLNKLKHLDQYRDSVFKLHYPRSKQDSLIRIGFDLRRHYDMELDRLSIREMNNNTLYTQIDDTIAGYYARIITQRDTFDVIVSSLTFHVVCPVFMYENNPDEKFSGKFRRR